MLVDKLAVRSVQPIRVGLHHLLRDKRLSRGHSQPEAAAIMNVTQQELSKWERGRSSPRNPADLLAVAEYLEIPVQDVVLLAAGYDPQTAPVSLLDVTAELRAVAERLADALESVAATLERRTGGREVPDD